MTESARASVYLGEAIVDDIEARSAASARTWSGQLRYLCQIGVRASQMIGPDPRATKDDSGGRQYFYPQSTLVGSLDALRARLTATTGHVWSFSAVVRAACIVGMRIDDVVQRFMVGVLDRLQQGGEVEVRSFAEAVEGAAADAAAAIVGGAK